MTLDKSVEQHCELLLSYPVGKLFTKDTPSAKEKKHEARCMKIVDTYWSIESVTHQRIRELLRDLQSSFTIGCNECIIEPVLTSGAQLQARFEVHKKLIQKSVKSEKALVDYYEPLWKCELFPLLQIQLVRLLLKNNQDVNDSLWKKVYYDAYKLEKKAISGNLTK